MNAAGRLVALGALACAAGVFAQAPYIAPTDDMFYDDFSSGIVDPAKWYAANKNWGGKDASTGEDYNGGVVPANLGVRDGVLRCVAHGNLYEGDVAGIAKNGKPRADGKRVGACAVTREYYASGSYEIRARVAPVAGVCCTMWTFEYEELYPGDPGFQGSGDYYVVNHEIDIEMPGRPGSAHTGIGYDYALCNTWVGENGNEYTSSHVKLPRRQDDGAFHVYRFDWHTGGADGGSNIAARVEFYVDGVLVGTNASHVPTRAARFWVGAWFPKDWAGTPDFDTAVFQVDWVRIVPFHEPNDQGPEEGADQTGGLVDPVNVVPPELWEVGSPVASAVTARLDGTGALVFSGNGAVTNFASAADAPWAAEAADVTSIVVGEGVTGFGPGSLAGLSNVSAVNGTTLARYVEVLRAAGKPVPGGGPSPTNLVVTVLQSPDLVHWTPVDVPVAAGEDGRSVRVPVPADADRGFFKFEAE